MIFNNHPPIKLENAEVWGKATRDGGRYRDFGFNNYTIYKGKTCFHLVHEYNDGCDWGYGTQTTRTYLGKFNDLDAIKDFLETKKDWDGYSQKFPWWASCSHAPSVISFRLPGGRGPTLSGPSVRPAPARS